jgi:hypothetical protein
LKLFKGWQVGKNVGEDVGKNIGACDVCTWLNVF